MAATVGDDVSEDVRIAGSDACSPGDTLSGRYRIVRFIARGGTGAVYEADDLVVGTPVALKVLHPERAHSATAVERLHRELVLARRISHRNVCRLHDVGEDAGRIFLTMELLDGETLAARIARGPVPFAEIDAIAEQLVAALEAAHAEGVVHRDFKPHNVILVDDRVVVTDFGLARSTQDDGESISLTGDTAMIGTPAYMAPEQVEGREATTASDVYALGVVLFELATGHVPFREATALATATARLHRDPPRVVRAGLDPRWAAAIARCLLRDAAARFPSARAVLDARRARPRRFSLVLPLLALALAVAAPLLVLLDSTPDAPAVPAPHFFPAHVRPTSTKSSIMYDRADAALVVGDRVQARSHLEIAVASSPDDPIAQAALAEVLDALGHQERAEEASRRAMRFHDQLPEESRIYVEAIDAIVRGDQAATTILERLVALAPSEPTYRVRLATALVASKPDLAARALDGVRLSPFTTALLDAKIAEARNDSIAALAHAVRATTLAPSATLPNEHAMALVIAAGARWRLDDAAGAKRDYEQALRLGDTGVQLAARRGLMGLASTSAYYVGEAEQYRAQATLLRTLGDRDELASVLMDGASLFAEIGGIDAAEAMMAEARQHAVAIASPHHIAWIDALEARLALWRGQLARARTLAERAYHAGGELARVGIQGNAFYTWTHVLLELDDPAELAKLRALRTETVERLVDCVAAYREGELDRAERIGHALANVETYEGRIALVVVAQVAIARGRLDEAEVSLAKVATHMQRDEESIVARERLEQAQAMLLAKRGRLGDALAQLDRYIATCATAGLGICEVRSLGVAAQLAIIGGSADAKQRAATTIARAEGLEMHRTAREVREVLAR